MNRFITTLFIFTIFLSYTSCKKDTKVKLEDEPTILSCDLNTPIFSRDINTMDTFYDILEDMERNILLLGKKHLIKYDYKGNLIWSQLVNWTGKPQNIIQAEGDNYLTTNSTFEIQEHQPDQFYEKESIGKELKLTSYYRGRKANPFYCYNYYDVIRKDFGEAPDVYTGTTEPQNFSKCFVNKIDKNGNIIWTKSFDGNYFKGQSICKTWDGNYAVITYKLSGLYQTVNFDKNGIWQDSIHQLIDRNSITIHKIDRDGNTIWSKTINGIVSLGEPLNWAIALTHLTIISVKQHIFIQTQKQLFVLDENGNLISTPKHYHEPCKATPYGLVANNNTAYAIGGVAYSGTSPIRSFCTSFDETGNLIEEKPLEAYFDGYPAKYHFVSDGIIACNYDIIKYDRIGNIIWSSTNQERIMCASVTCKEGVIFVSTKTGVPRLIKTDRNGLY